MNPHDDRAQGTSLLRILAVAIPVALFTAVAVHLWGNSLRESATAQLNRDVLSTMLPNWAEGGEVADLYEDADKDLVADTPEDEGLLQQPESLVFSYIASSKESRPESAGGQWDALLSAIGGATSKPVTVVEFEQLNEQLEAMRRGQIHILGLGTGAAPLAVQTAGFVPLCTMANADGEVGYKMVLLTSADSGIKELADVKGRKVVFVRPTSNSGFKAAFVQLYDDAGLLPEQDYEWSFSLSHESSVHDVLSGAADVAPVASDILAKMVEQGDVDESQYRVIYKSEAFPPAVIGCAHNLPAGMIEQIRSTLIGLDWDGTGLEEQFGPMGAAKFVEVNYKNDWANIRRIDDAVRRLATPRGPQ